MTIQELLDYCHKNNIKLDTHIALRDKDDFLLIHNNVGLDSHPYFGNCRAGTQYLKEFAPRDADGEIDYDNLPQFLILGTGN